MEITDYGNGWIGYAPMGPPLPRELRPKPIATYRALLPSNGDSAITFADDVGRAALITALNGRPDYMPFVWPDRVLHTDADLRTLALLKILTVVSFGAGWRSLDPTEILVQATIDLPDLASPTVPWLLATGEVLANGDASAGFADLPSDDSLTFPDIIGGRDYRLMAALAGADLIRRIRAGSASWDPFSGSPLGSSDIG